MSRQISTITGIAVIIATAAIAAGGVFAYQYFLGLETANSYQATTNVQPNLNVQNSNTQTAGWQSYVNDQYGFKFQYPDNNFDGLKINEGTINTLDLGSNAYAFLETNIKSAGSDEIRFTVIASQYSFDDYKKSLSQRYQDITNLKQVVVDGQSVYIFETGSLQMGYYYETLTYVVPDAKNSTFIYFSLTHGSSYDPDRLEYLSISDKSFLGEIISTFKFTK